MLRRRPLCCGLLWATWRLVQDRGRDALSLSLSLARTILPRLFAALFIMSPIAPPSSLLFHFKLNAAGQAEGQAQQDQAGQGAEGQAQQDQAGQDAG